MPPIGARSDSMSDGLRKLLAELAQMQVYPDADIQFLTQLQQVIIGKIRSTLNAPGQSPAGPGGGPGQPGPDQMGPGGPAGPIPGGGPVPMGGPAMGLSATGGAPGSPNVDELSRVLGSTGAAG